MMWNRREKMPLQVDIKKEKVLTVYLSGEIWILIQIKNLKKK